MKGPYEQSLALLERARQVIPAGVWGHNRFPAFLDPGSYPYFARSGRGARFRDVDGNEFIDLMCGYGAMVNGHAHPEVEAAAHEHGGRGGCLNQPTEVSVELAEWLCRHIRGADWAAFGKNGSDATWTALLVARAFTGRRLVVCARGAFHGSHMWCDWCNPGAGRCTADERSVLLFDWNDPEGLAALLDEHPGQVAAIMLTPFHHPIPGRAIEPAEGFWEAVRDLADRHGALVVSDDVRVGFRLELAGSHAHYGFEPDLVCMSKAIGNGHALSAVTGRDALRQAATDVFVAGTFWSSAPAMAAALTNLHVLERDGAIETMRRLGDQLVSGLIQAGREHGWEVEVSGASSMPTVTIAGDDDFSAMGLFASRMAAQGSFVHPTHNWFVSAAHTSGDIEEVVQHARDAFSGMSRALSTSDP